MAVATFTKAGNKSTTPAKLDKKIFGVKAENHELLKAAYIAYLANGRGNFAQTKKRGEVRGGGRKPWRQKGTGRARFGSIRTPIWRGGGITFGPTGQENHSHKLHTNAKRQALRQALSIAAEENKIIVIESLQFKDNKTSEASKLLTKLGAQRNILIAVDSKLPEVQLALRNLKNVKLVSSNYLNVFDVMNADTIIFTTDGLKKLYAWLGGTE